MINTKQLILGITIALCVTVIILTVLRLGFTQGDQNGERSNELSLACINAGGITLITNDGLICVWSKEKMS